MEINNPPKLKSNKKLTASVPFTKLIPNILTLIGLVIGLSSVRFALDSRWEMAVYCIILATIFDAIDGRVARMLNATSHFGAELDSLCDFANFGVCPALLIYLWSFQQYEYKVISWASIMLFTVCMALRLARFNTSIISSSSSLNLKEDLHQKYFFTGIPAPIGAILALIPMILDFEVTAYMKNFSIRNYTLLIDFYIVIIAFLLTSRLPTISTKHFHIKPEYLSLFLISSAIIIILIVIYPWYTLPFAAILYLLSIPLALYITKKL